MQRKNYEEMTTEERESEMKQQQLRAQTYTKQMEPAVYERTTDLNNEQK